MKKLIFTLLFVSGTTFADTALIQLAPDGKALALPIAAPPSKDAAPTATSPTDIGSLPPKWPQGYIYYTLPGSLLGKQVNLVTPWSAAIAAEGYDFIGKEAITQGYLPVFEFWKLTGVFGAGLNGKGEGSPMGGGILSLANAKINDSADFHLAVTGGYNLNAGHALAVLSGSVQFLK